MVKKRKHIYVLDTNILMKYPNAVYGFDDNEVVITSTTQEELDNHKNDKGERGMLTRHAISVIDKLREESHRQKSNLSKGVKINNGKGLFRVEPDNITENLAQGWTLDKPDNRILSCCKNLGGILVTEDGNMRNKADVIGVEAQSYHNVEIKSSGYTGRSEIYISGKDFAAFASNHSLPVVKGMKDVDGSSEFVENEYFVVHNADNPSSTLLAKYSDSNLVRIREKFPIGKITLRNVGQRFAMDALFDDNIPLVILKGPAGTAKTFLAVVAGMAGVHEKWEHIIATRSNTSLDKDLGALPGTEEEKVSPLLRGVQDALKVYYLAGGTAECDVRMSIEDTFARGDIDIEALGFMRGRSISNSFLIVDEAQNTTAHQIESIVTRLSSGTMCVTGDPGQIDDPSLDSKNNGLTFACETMKGSKLCAQITFTEDECERSELAREAAARMSTALD